MSRKAFFLMSCKQIKQKAASSGLTNALNVLGDMTIAAGAVRQGINDTQTALNNCNATKTNAGGGLVGSLAAISSVAGPAGKGIGAVLNIAKGVTGFFKAAKESAKKAKAEYTDLPG